MFSAVTDDMEEKPTTTLLLHISLIINYHQVFCRNGMTSCERMIEYNNLCTFQVTTDDEKSNIESSNDEVSSKYKQHEFNDILYTTDVKMMHNSN